MNQKVRHDLSSPCPYCSAGPHHVCGHLSVAATSRVQQTDVDATVLEKMISSTRDHFGDILPTLKAISRGEWHWGANQRCRYIEIRIDTHDGGCMLFDRQRLRISPEQFARQAYQTGKRDPWPHRNALDAAPAAKFKVGDLVTKVKGSQWKGCVVGTYSTTLTPEGYAVESSTERGSVQIYPAATLELVEAAQAEQSVITPETEFPVSAQGAAITSASGAPPAEQQASATEVALVGAYARLPDFDSGDEPIWEAVFKWKAANPGSDASKKAMAVEGAIIKSLRDFADRTHALRMEQAPKAAPGVGNSGFDYKTAADFLNGKTVSDEAVRKFVATSRCAHDERAALSATLLAMHGVLTSREAEIALLKNALMEAEAAPAPNLAKALNQKTLQNDSLHTRSEHDNT